MLGDREFLPLQRLALAHGGEAARILVVAVVVLAFLVERQETVEFYHLAGGAQFQHARAGLGRDVDGGALHFRRFHLAGDGAGPDQFIEPGLVGIEAAAHLGRPSRQIGGTNGFVRFLGVLGLGLVQARRFRHIGLAVILADHGARLR